MPHPRTTRVGTRLTCLAPPVLGEDVTRPPENGGTGAARTALGIVIRHVPGLTPGLTCFALPVLVRGMLRASGAGSRCISRMISAGSAAEVSPAREAGNRGRGKQERRRCGT